MRGIIHLFFTLVCILQAAVARPRFSNPGVQLSKRADSNVTTNGARLQVGLPLLKPRKFFNPTRVGGERPILVKFCHFLMLKR